MADEALDELVHKPVRAQLAPEPEVIHATTLYCLYWKVVGSVTFTLTVVLAATVVDSVCVHCKIKLAKLIPYCSKYLVVLR